MVVVGSRYFGDGLSIIPLMCLVRGVESANGRLKLFLFFGFDDGRQVAPLGPLAVDAVRFDLCLQVRQAGKDQPRDASVRVLAQLLGEVRGVDDEARVAPRGAVADPVLIEQEDTRVRCKFPEPAGGGEPGDTGACLLYTSPSPRDGLLSRMPSSA